MTHPEIPRDAENILEYWMPSAMAVTSVMRTSSCLSRWVRILGPLTLGGDSHTARNAGRPGNELDGGLITAMFPLRNRMGLSCFLVTGSSLEMFQISSHIYINQYSAGISGVTAAFQNDSDVTGVDLTQVGLVVGCCPDRH